MQVCDNHGADSQVKQAILLREMCVEVVNSWGLAIWLGGDYVNILQGLVIGWIIGQLIGAIIVFIIVLRS